MKLSRVFLALGALAFLSAAAPAQNRSIQWGQDVEAAIKQAKTSKLPMMFYIISRSDDRPEDVERDQIRAFGDPMVFELSKRYVCCKMSRSRYKDQLQKWGKGAGTNLELVFATADGEMLGDLSPGGVAQPQSLATKMAMVSRVYRDRLFDKEVRPVFEKEAATPQETAKALDLISNMLITSADKSVVALAERTQDAGLRGKCHQTLGVLSTRDAVEALLKAAATDKSANDALAKCTPEAADWLSDKLGGEDAVTHRLAYAALCKICKLKDGKNDKFWDGTNEKVKKDEIARVTKIAKSGAEKWRERVGQYR